MVIDLFLQIYIYSSVTHYHRSPVLVCIPTAVTVLVLASPPPPPFLPSIMIQTGPKILPLDSKHVLTHFYAIIILSDGLPQFAFSGSLCSDMLVSTTLLFLSSFFVI